MSAKNHVYTMFKSASIGFCQRECNLNRIFTFSNYFMRSRPILSKVAADNYQIR